MFYSQIILAKKGPLGKIWIAAHWDKKLNKAQIFQTNINTSVENILQPTVPLALRMSGHLLLGLVRIYSRKVKYLMTDASEALVKIQMAFRPGATDMPAGATVAAPGAIEAQGFGDFDDVGMDGVNIDVFSNAFAVEGVDNWMEAAPVNLGRRADINLDPADSMSMVSGQDRSGSFMLDVDMSFGGNGSDLNMNMSSRMSMDARSSRVSDIEAVRDADNSGLRSGRLSMSMDVMAADNDKDEDQMGGGYDDLGAPTNPNELALDAADVGGGGGGGIDDGADIMDMDDGMGGMDADGGFDGPENDAPEFNPDMGDLGQGGDADDTAQGGGGALDDEDTLNLDDAGFSRTDLPEGGAVEQEEEEPSPKRKATRTRKRKLVMNQVTLIDMATMKAQLQDTSDITRKRWRGPRRVAQEVRSPEEQLMEPLMPSLAPPLHNMLRACMTPGGFPFPFRKRVPAPAAEAAEHGSGARGGGDEGAEEEEEEEEEEIEGPDPTADGMVGGEQEHEDVELTRRADDSLQSIAAAGGLKDTSLGSSFKDGGAGLEMDGPAGGDGGDVDAFDLGRDGGDMDTGGGGEGMEGFGGGFEADLNNEDVVPDMQGGEELDLAGGVNDLEASRDDIDLNADKDQDGGAGAGARGREDGPDATGVLPRHKWHPHTVKVLRLVQKQLKAPPRGASGVTHASLAKGAKRRTAAGAFFELLQLKTWDFVELSQDEPYGDINVTAGPRLNDEVQAANV